MDLPAFDTDKMAKAYKEGLERGIKKASEVINDESLGNDKKKREELTYKFRPLVARERGKSLKTQDHVKASYWTGYGDMLDYVYDSLK